ncbi:impaired sucrose induction 1 [Klebsormidium nitens]|uniref:Impaired sucrose induction 1 n=1 Tax=Klebsormidium nitens TaxID=105231 RepID=A0A1Y1I5F9_KLENI|nr:impaired sucrose induction 1 [Klebsormidium nitens]|eukprot:GAQ86194.1 impaired sucrose induction 1 [Klebsormidium nitens]
MAFKLPPPPWQSPSWHGAPPALDDIIASLDEQRQARELALQLRLGIQDAQAEFSYLRLKGLRALAATVAACLADSKWTRRFREAQLSPELQIVPCLFSHSLAPPPRSQPPSPSGSPGRVLGQPAVPLSPPGEEEVVVALHLLQGCCLVNAICKEQATKRGAVKALAERLLAATVVPVRVACLDALLTLLIGNPENVQEFKRLGALKQTTDLVQNAHVLEQVRLKALEFLALLLADASHTAKQYPDGAEDLPTAFEEEIRTALGTVVLNQLQQAVENGAFIEGRLETLAQSILHATV